MKANHYRNAVVRDLAWACFEPPIMHSPSMTQAPQKVANCGLALTPAREQWLNRLDQNPAPLHEHIDNISSQRLGIYFEGLWHFFLQQDDRVDLLAHNLPVRDSGMTLGEFDCIYFCHERQQHVHLELAVKYFLGRRCETSTEQTSHWHEWWGPECRDRLDLKIRHMLDRQIKLADSGPGAACLKQLGVDEVAREVEIKGYLFHNQHDALPAPLAYNRDGALNLWLAVCDLPAHCEHYSDQDYLVLPKSRWLSPALASEDSQPLSAGLLQQSLLSHFAGQSRPKLVAVLDSRGIEQERFFVVDPDWGIEDLAKQARPRI